MEPEKKQSVPNLKSPTIRDFEFKDNHPLMLQDTYHFYNHK